MIQEYEEIADTGTADTGTASMVKRYIAFKELSTQQILEIVSARLVPGVKNTQICAKFNISAYTLKRCLQAAGYKYSKSLKDYEFVGQEETSATQIFVPTSLNDTSKTLIPRILISSISWAILVTESESFGCNLSLALEKIISAGCDPFSKRRVESNEIEVTAKGVNLKKNKKNSSKKPGVAGP